MNIMTREENIVRGLDGRIEYDADDEGYDSEVSINA